MAGPEEEEPAQSNGQVVKLTTVDGGEFVLPVAAAIESDLLKQAMNRGEDDDDEDAHIVSDEPIPLLRVNKKCLEKVVDFLKHYHEEKLNEIPTPISGTSFKEVVTQKWYQDFVEDENIDKATLFEVISASNYMVIKPLLDLACLKLTFQLSGKNSEEIREMLNLPSLSPEEEAAAREEHRWIFEENS